MHAAKASTPSSGSGFTLIELLVVIAIIAVLNSSGAASAGGSAG
jgi:prepilin-type N-terminal cleavage/methylation domain-containing protein